MHVILGIVQQVITKCCFVDHERCPLAGRDELFTWNGIATVSDFDTSAMLNDKSVRLWTVDNMDGNKFLDLLLLQVVVEVLQSLLLVFEVVGQDVRQLGCLLYNKSYTVVLSILHLLWSRVASLVL